MKRATAFLSQQGLEVDIRWYREDPDSPLDFRGTIDGIPWAFELKALRKDPDGYHRKLGHPNERRSLDQQLETLAEPLPQIRDDSDTLQSALDQAFSDAGKAAKMEALKGDRYCLVVHNQQFTFVDSWSTITMPDLGAFDLVIALHQDTITSAWTWEVLRQTGIDKPLPSQDVGGLADIVEFKMSSHGMPDAGLIRNAWGYLEGLDPIEDRISKAFESPESIERQLPE